MQSLRKRPWQFGLRTVLYATLLVATYFAGRSHRVTDFGALTERLRNVESQREIADRNAREQARQLRVKLWDAEEDAQQWRERYDRLAEEDRSR